MGEEKYKDLNYLKSMAVTGIPLYKDIEYLRSMACDPDINVVKAKKCMETVKKSSFMGWWRRLERLAQGEIYLSRSKDFEIRFQFRGKEELIYKYYQELNKVLKGEIKNDEVIYSNDKVTENEVGEIVIECRKTKAGGLTTMGGERFDDQGRNWRERVRVKAGDEIEVRDISNTGKHRCARVKILKVNPIQYQIKRQPGRCLICEK